MTSTTGPNSADPERGFTLLELILVLMVVGIALSAAAPTLRMALRGSAIDNTALGIVTLARWARAQSANEARVYRLTFEPQAKYCLLTRDEGLGYALIGNDFGQPYYFGDDLTVEIERSASLVQNAIDFYPDGTLTPAVIVLRDLQNQVVQISAATPSEEFRIPASLREVR